MPWNQNPTDEELREQLRQALNREATMRETLGRAQTECTRLVEELREARRAAVTPLFTSEDTETLERAVYTWGPLEQLRMLGEEALELALACRHVDREREDAWENLAEEVADVQIMLGQLTAIAERVDKPGLEHAVRVRREAKLERLRERLLQYPPVHTGFRCKI